MKTEQMIKVADFIGEAAKAAFKNGALAEAAIYGIYGGVLTYCSMKLLFGTSKKPKPVSEKKEEEQANPEEIKRIKEQSEKTGQITVGDLEKIFAITSKIYMEQQARRFIKASEIVDNEHHDSWNDVLCMDEDGKWFVV